MRGIAKVTDTSSNILLAVDLTSEANVTAAGGVVNGTATFSAAGMNPGSAGSVSFTDIAGFAALQYEGQIVVTVSTTQLCKPDDGSIVSGSVGEAKSGNQYLWSFQDANPTNQGYLLVSAAAALVGKLHASDVQSAALSVTSAGKDAYTEVCVSWQGTSGVILVNGGLFQTFTRANFADVVNKLVIGAAFNGTAMALVNGTFKSVVVSRNSVRFWQRYDRLSVGFFGNSFVDNADSAGGIPRLDNRASALINRYFSEYGWTCPRIVWHGYPSYTTGDVGLGTDLSSVIDTFVEAQTHVAVLICGENDSVSATARLTTDANYKAFIEKIAGEAAVNGVTYRSCRKIIVCTPGSLRQHASLDTEANRAGREAVHASVEALPAWWNATYPTRAGLVRVVDLHAILGGDVDGNLNYQGALNVLGNLASGGSASPVASPDNRHPSGLGNHTLFRAIAGAI